MWPLPVAVVGWTPRARPLLPAADREQFRAMVVGLFGLRRKQLLRALRELTGWDGERCGLILSRASLGSTIRGETVAPAEFARLYRALVDDGWRAG